MQYCYTMPIETLKESEIIDEIIGTQTPHLVIFEQNTKTMSLTTVTTVLTIMPRATTKMTRLAYSCTIIRVLL